MPAYAIKHIPPRSAQPSNTIIRRLSFRNKRNLQPEASAKTSVSGRGRPRRNASGKFKCRAAVDGAESAADRAQSAQSWIENWRNSQATSTEGETVSTRVENAQAWIEDWRRKQSSATVVTQATNSDKQAAESESWWKKYVKFDRAKIASMGACCALSYGFVSNFNYMSYLVISVFLSMKRTGMSPLLDNEAFNVFTASYLGFFLLGNMLRPFRIAIAVYISPFFEKLVKFLQSSFKLKKKAYAFALAIFLVNCCGTTSYMFGGLAFASKLTGVPVGWLQLSAFFKAAKAAKAAGAAATA